MSSRNAAIRSSVRWLAASVAALPISALSRLNSFACSPGMRVASRLNLGNEIRHRCTVSRATALQGKREP
ncbi:hypothetical protein D3C72_1300420 [compost metagenome]